MGGLIEVAAGVAAAAGAAWAVRGRSSTLFGPSVWHGDRRRRAIALTFDDGPSESTPQLLEALERLGVRATFFQCGCHAERLPEIAREVSARGHEIGNHTFGHPALWMRSPEFVEREIEVAQRVLDQIHGAPPKYFRPTYGARWFGMRAAQRRHGLLGVMWSAIGLDWKLPAEAVAKRLEQRAAHGAIFCLHDGRELRTEPDIGATIEAVERLVPRLRGEGYGFETISEVLCQKNLSGG